MDTKEITKMRFIEVFRRLNIVLFTTNDVKKAFSLNKDNTLKHLLIRLHKNKIIQRISRDRYCFLLAENRPHEFTIANFLISPSYVSLESALSFYQLIDQFPYRITSIVISKTSQRKIDNKIYVYSKIKKDLFKDFIKIDDFLIATKEKAIYDYIYFVYKGLRPVNTLLDMKDCLKDESIRNYLLRNSGTDLNKFINKYVKL